ncbi:hypothetical protein AA313_de0209143 [Arthrobotrys entomopaga]|nr:hypothetical protein AA313_de0209143 [Arthrobotrys entomopaga]
MFSPGASNYSRKLFTICTLVTLVLLACLVVGITQIRPKIGKPRQQANNLLQHGAETNYVDGKPVDGGMRPLVEELRPGETLEPPTENPFVGSSASLDRAGMKPVAVVVPPEPSSDAVDVLSSELPIAPALAPSETVVANKPKHTLVKPIVLGFKKSGHTFGDGLQNEATMIEKYNKDVDDEDDDDDDDERKPGLDFSTIEKGILAADEIIRNKVFPKERVQKDEESDADDGPENDSDDEPDDDDEIIETKTIGDLEDNEIEPTGEPKGPKYDQSFETAKGIKDSIVALPTPKIGGIKNPENLKMIQNKQLVDNLEIKKPMAIEKRAEIRSPQNGGRMQNVENLRVDEIENLEKIMAIEEVDKSDRLPQKRTGSYNAMIEKANKRIKIPERRITRTSNYITPKKLEVAKTYKITEDSKADDIKRYFDLDQALTEILTDVTF